ncbi:MAG: hypothetical protein VW270_06360 [Candidatus Poseidoniales archaeon]
MVNKPENNVVEVFVTGVSGAAKAELHNDSNRSTEKDPKNSDGRTELDSSEYASGSDE